MPLILPFRNHVPTIASDAFIAENATIIGDVVIGSKASVWFGCVLRGDTNFIRIGARTDLQDGTVVHVARDADSYPQTIEAPSHQAAFGHLRVVSWDIKRAIPDFAVSAPGAVSVVAVYR